LKTGVMNKISRLINNPKISAITICVLCLAGMLSTKYIEILFRFSEYRWFYQYGSLFSKGMVLLMFGCSMFHPILVVSTKGKEWRKYWIWMLIAFIPFLYFTISMTFAMSRTIE